MTRNRPENSNSLCCILILLIISIVAKGDLQDLNLQHKRSHLEDKKFPDSDYDDVSIEDEQEPDSDSNWNKIPLKSAKTPDLHSAADHTTNVSSILDPNIKWDKTWNEATSTYDFGQLSAVDFDLDGNIALFSRRERTWGARTFDSNNIFDIKNGPIQQNTIILFNKKGKIIVEWGKSMFYLPHGLTIDLMGNYWLTDVAMHQVFKFNAEDIEKNMDILKQLQYEPPTQPFVSNFDPEDLFTNSVLKPSLILGEAFTPGNDNKRFCKPTAVAVAENGDFFVSDGYCNSRIIKFNSNGERILTFAHGLLSNGPYALEVPHSLALANELNFIYVADREHGRVLCYYADNGLFHKEYKNPMLGGKIYGIDYANERLYIVNGPNPFTTTHFHVRGYVMDINSGKIVSQFGPDNDMIAPHDIAVNKNGSEIYVPELNNHYIYRFVQDQNPKSTIPISSTPLTNSTQISSNTSVSLKSKSNITINGLSTRTNMTLILTLVISAMLLIGMCVAIAVVVARCQKRGCLLSTRRRDYWSNERNDNFTLSSLLTARQSKNFRIFDKRPNTKDFSKLNTEPETSDEEHLEDSLII